MAKKKQAVPKDEKFEKHDFDLFAALKALDNKDYDYYDSLTPEQQKKFVPYMMTHWMSAVSRTGNLARASLLSVDLYANKHLFNENVMKHPKLQWQMLCASGLGMGRQQHQWIPHISKRISSLKEPAKKKEIKDYFKKIYSTANEDDLNLITEMFITEHNKKMYLAKKFPNMKFEDIELLNELVTDDDIKNYEEEFGN